MNVYQQQALPSLCPLPDRVATPVTVALVQMRWLHDPELHRQQLEEGVARAADAGAEIIFLPELTLSRYPADRYPNGRADALAEPLETGPTVAFLRALATRYDLHVHGSLFEATDAPDGRGFNTAVVVDSTGTLVGKTRKTHIPLTAGYWEDHYFTPGPADNAYPIHRLDLDSGVVPVGLPTCWDEWFPEVARAYGLNGAALLCYPTAIGSEPDYPDFDTAPLWQQTIVGHAIANGLFMVVPNRWGSEGLIQFYGSSFIADPFGRILGRAPRDESCVLVATLDLAQRQDWLTLFPFFRTRRPDSYGQLVAPVANGEIHTASKSETVGGRDPL